MLERKSEKTNIALPKNAQPKMLWEPACLSARPRNGPNVPGVPLKRACFEKLNRSPSLCPLFLEQRAAFAHPCAKGSFDARRPYAKAEVWSSAPEVQQQQFQALRAQNNFIADLEQQVYAKTELLRATKGQAATKSATRAESQSAPLPPRHQASPLHITRLSPKGMFEWSNSQHL